MSGNPSRFCCSEKFLRGFAAETERIILKVDGPFFANLPLDTESHWPIILQNYFFFPKVKETILEQISTVEVNSMQQVTQLSAVVVMATEGKKDIAVTAQV